MEYRTTVKRSGLLTQVKAQVAVARNHVVVFARFKGPAVVLHLYVVDVQVERVVRCAVERVFLHTGKPLDQVGVVLFKLAAQHRAGAHAYGLGIADRCVAEVPQIPGTRGQPGVRGAARCVRTRIGIRRRTVVDENIRNLRAADADRRIATTAYGQVGS